MISLSATTSAAGDHLRLQIRHGTVPLAYAREGSTVWLVAQYRAARWAVEILRAGRARLEMGGEAVEGDCRLVSDGVGRAAVLERFRAKYGSAQVTKWFDPPGRVVEVTLGGSRTPADDAADTYFHWLEAEFDSIAADYDRHILGNPVNRLLRDRSVALLRRTFPSRERLLEIGCGSGTETVELLEDGHEVTAVDISGAMLETVRAKARSRGLAERLTVVKLRAGRLSEMAGDGRPTFQGAYSTYGALNCEPDLGPIPPALRTLLMPRGKFIAGVFNRWCGFETGVYSLLLRSDRAFGRWGRPVPVEVSRFCIDAFAYSPPEFAALFAGDFRPLALEGTPVLFPPSDLARYVRMFDRRFAVLDRLDARLGRAWPFRYFGDHFLMTLERRPDTRAPIHS